MTWQGRGLVLKSTTTPRFWCWSWMNEGNSGSRAMGWLTGGSEETSTIRELTMKLTRRMMMGVAMGGYLISAGAAMAKTDLTFWSWRTEDKAFYNDVIKKFQEKEPDISVKFETYAPENYQTILSTALAAGRGPDVIQARAYGNLETIAAPGYLLALDKQNV